MGCCSKKVEQEPEEVIEVVETPEPEEPVKPLPVLKLKTTKRGSTKLELAIIDRHNQLRDLHGVQPLRWSYECQQSAQNWADYLTQTGKIEYNVDQIDFGVNIFYSDDQKTTGADVVDSWYKQIKDYDFDNPSFSPATGLFTQMIWADSCYIGCGVGTVRNNLVVIANYDPPGNILHEEIFADNVLYRIK